MDICTISELLRYRPSDPECLECFNQALGLVEEILGKTWDSSMDDRGMQSVVDIRVSCKETLEDEEPCPIMGFQGYRFSIIMGETAPIQCVLIKSLKLVK